MPRRSRVPLAIGMTGLAFVALACGGIGDSEKKVPKPWVKHEGQVEIVGTTTGEERPDRDDGALVADPNSRRVDVEGPESSVPVEHDYAALLADRIPNARLITLRGLRPGYQQLLAGREAACGGMFCYQIGAGGRVGQCRAHGLSCRELVAAELVGEACCSASQVTVRSVVSLLEQLLGEGECPLGALCCHERFEQQVLVP